MRPRSMPIGLVLLLWTALACAAPATTATIDELMRKSGLWEQLAGISNEFQKSVDAGALQQGVQDPHAAAALHRAFTVAYGPDKLRPAVAVVLASKLSAEDAQAALDWLGTDLGTRITKLEEASAAGAPPERAAELAAALPPERHALYAQLSRVLHAGDVGATIVINVAYGLARGIRIAVPELSMQDPEQVRDALEARRPQLVELLEAQTIASNAVTYATLSDAELKRYIAFAETPAGRRYHAATWTALDAALSDAAVDAGRLLATVRST